jgi:hypothetical protein
MKTIIDDVTVKAAMSPFGMLSLPNSCLVRPPYHSILAQDTEAEKQIRHIGA